MPAVNRGGALRAPITTIDVRLYDYDMPTKAYTTGTHSIVVYYDGGIVANGNTQNGRWYSSQLQLQQSKGAVITIALQDASISSVGCATVSFYADDAKIQNGTIHVKLYCRTQYAFVWPQAYMTQYVNDLMYAVCVEPNDISFNTSAFVNFCGCGQALMDNFNGELWDNGYSIEDTDIMQDDADEWWLMISNNSAEFPYTVIASNIPKESMASGLAAFLQSAGVGRVFYVQALQLGELVSSF